MKRAPEGQKALDFVSLGALRPAPEQQSIITMLDIEDAARLCQLELLTGQQAEKKKRT